MFIKDWGSDRFGLADLSTPGILEHIGSLTRKDAVENQQANITNAVVPVRIAALLNDSGSDYIDAASVARSRLRVEALCKPKKLSAHVHLQAYVESSLMLMVMMEGVVPSAFTLPSSKVWKAPKERVRVWLSEERLPTELGWKRSERQLQVADILPVVKAIFDQKRAQSGYSLWSMLTSLFVGGEEKKEL